MLLRSLLQSTYSLYHLLPLPPQRQTLQKRFPFPHKKTDPHLQFAGHIKGLSYSILVRFSTACCIYLLRHLFRCAVFMSTDDSTNINSNTTQPHPRPSSILALQSYHLPVYICALTRFLATILDFNLFSLATSIVCSLVFHLSGLSIVRLLFLSQVHKTYLHLLLSTLVCATGLSYRRTSYAVS